MEYLIVLLVGVGAGTLSGVIGTGSSMLLMPVLVVLFGPQEAVPVMAIGAIMGNLGRVLAWRREVDWQACGAYCSTAIPGAVLGVHTLLVLPPHAVELALGIFFVSMIPARRWLSRGASRLSAIHLALLGGPVGFLTGILVSTGPITVPVFTSYGLERGAFLGTEAAASMAVYIAKVATFKGLGALPASHVYKGLIVGAALMAGSLLARSIVLRIPPAKFKLLVDGLMLSSGLSLLWASVR
ncbi:MAG: hypothetical protein JWQ76_2815 [Ramlibacter sp.]|nr:hypothetical protein [Ramlibacter sp.]